MRSLGVQNFHASLCRHGRQARPGCSVRPGSSLTLDQALCWGMRPGVQDGIDIYDVRSISRRIYHIGSSCEDRGGPAALQQEIPGFQSGIDDE